MSNYPAQIDNSNSLPQAADNLTPVQSSIFNNLRSAVLAIETSLGTQPFGVYSSVANRLNTLENTLGNLQIINLSQDLGGTLSNPIVIGIQGNPVSNATPAVGQVLGWDGIAWIPTTVPGSSVNFNGDLSGTQATQKVIGIQGIPITNTSPTTGQALIFNGSQWAPGSVISGSAGGDLNGTYPNPSVTKIQGTPVSTNSVANDGYALVSIGGTYVPTGVIPIYNAKNFGAKGNGSTDDTLAIHFADLAAQISSGTIFLPSGTYNIASSLTISSPIQFADGALISINTVCPNLTINGKIRATYDQHIFSGSNQVQSVTPTGFPSHPAITVTAPFGIANLQNILVKIIVGGTLGNMAFQLSLGGSSEYFGPDIDTPSLNFVSSNTSSYSFTIPGFGINILFPANNYTANDVYSVNCGGIFNLGNINTVISPKWFGAIGNGTTDDTAAVQSAFSYFTVSLSANNNNGTIVIPSGNYKLTGTISAMGNVSSNIHVKGEFGATFTWFGTRGVTMFDLYGLNQTVFENINFFGNNLAGCGTWLHNAQGLKASALNGVTFHQCIWNGVLAGLSVACNLGDSIFSPTNVIQDLLGHTMNISCPGAFGSGASTHGATVGVNCILQAGISINSNSGTNTLTLTGLTGFGLFGNGQSVWISDTFGSGNAYRTLVTSFIGNVLTVQTVLPFTAHAGTTTVSLGAPNAQALSTLPASSSVTITSFAVAGAQVSGVLFDNNCIFGGGLTPDTSVSTNLYSYALCAVYGSANTEQFGFINSDFGETVTIFGFYCPDGPNNELFFDNVQFGEYVAAAVYNAGDATKLKMTQCATESNNIYGTGYFLWAPNCHSYLDGCEILSNNAGNIQQGSVNGNPTIFAGQVSIKHCLVSDPSVTPVIMINTIGSAIVEQCVWTLYSNLSIEPVPQIPVWDSSLNDLTRNIPVQTNFGQQANHNVTLRYNLASVNTGSDAPTPDMVGAPISLQTGGTLSPVANPTATEMYRNQYRTVTSRYDITPAQLPGHNAQLFLCAMPPKTRVISVLIATTIAWTSAISFSMGTGTDSPTIYTKWMSLTDINNIGLIRLDSIPWDQANTGGGTWNVASLQSIGVTFDNTYGAQSTGATSIYITTEEDSN